MNSILDELIERAEFDVKEGEAAEHEKCGEAVVRIAFTFIDPNYTKGEEGKEGR